MSEKETKGAEYDFLWKASALQGHPAGLQHVLAMFVGNLTPPFNYHRRLRPYKYAGICQPSGRFAAERHAGSRNCDAGSALRYWTSRRKGSDYHGNQFRLYRSVQQRGGSHGRRNPVLWSDYDGFHFRRNFRGDFRLFLKAPAPFFPGSLVTGTVVLSIGLSLIAVGVQFLRRRR